MLSEGKRNEELIKGGLVVKENEVLSLPLLPKALYSRSVPYTGISTEENAESVSHDKVSFMYPFFLILAFFCHRCLLKSVYKRIPNKPFFISSYHANLKCTLASKTSIIMRARAYIIHPHKIFVKVEMFRIC